MAQNNLLNEIMAKNLPGLGRNTGSPENQEKFLEQHPIGILAKTQNRENFEDKMKAAIHL